MESVDSRIKIGPQKAFNHISGNFCSNINFEIPVSLLIKIVQVKRNNVNTTIA